MFKSYNLKFILKYLLYLLIIPLAYGVISLLLGSIPVNNGEEEKGKNAIFLTTNGVHLDIILPIKNMEDGLLKDIYHDESENYLAFGWGDRDFYIETRTWDDLNIQTALQAAFLSGPALIHVTRFQHQYTSWVEVKVSDRQLRKLQNYIAQSFDTNEKGGKSRIKGAGYSSNDDFYRAKGSFYFFKTCNTWVNEGFKESGLKACLWTPFDFALINKYE